eukprot:CAMPEP_0203799010 /NCGR_PEP_ID=MMETSP0100_2-20121128/9662_1 /ASSEMBLY_ACC=CAM_ASM_000210 /TAXON_ID=96639 /ORGANISM=" , Strain NY0313808BC1" /LENGTH=187 /DNA_ID=CAMNT_0050704811 /DNA_START=592 /DNA_END=1152 /DNA_ORIENTATION=+
MKFTNGIVAAAVMISFAEARSEIAAFFESGTPAVRLPLECGMRNSLNMVQHLSMGGRSCLTQVRKRDCASNEYKIYDGLCMRAETICDTEKFVVNNMCVECLPDSSPNREGDQCVKKCPETHVATIAGGKHYCALKVLKEVVPANTPDEQLCQTKWHSVIQFRVAHISPSVLRSGGIVVHCTPLQVQ